MRRRIQPVFGLCQSLLTDKTASFVLCFPQVEGAEKEVAAVELGTQLKKHRARLNLSQDELAQQVYVTRQTISNWETGKSYPDIHSLLLLSAFFQVSLDQLIKGDVEQMKEEIKKTEIDRLNRWGNILAVLFVVMLVSAMPLFLLLDWAGVAIWAALAAVTLAVALHVERIKKENQVFTYKEIVAFTQGKRLDELEHEREVGKRPYQRFVLALVSGLIGLAVVAVMSFLVGLLIGAWG